MTLSTLDTSKIITTANNEGFVAWVARTIKPLLHGTFGGFGVYDVLLWGLLWISVA